MSIIFDILTVTDLKIVVTPPPAEVTTWQNLVTSTGGSFTANSTTIATNFINTVKPTTYYSKIKYLLPMLGGNLSASLVPLIDVLGVGKATNNNFVNADFSETTGLQGNGTSKYLNTLIKPGQLGTSGNGGMGYWENNISFSGTGVEPMGCYDATGGSDQRFVFDLRTNPLRSFRWGEGGATPTNGTPTNGHYYGQRPSITSRILYINSAVDGSSSLSAPATNINLHPIRILGTNDGAGVYWAGRCALSYMTDGTLTAQEVSDFHSALNTYLISATGK